MIQVLNSDGTELGRGLSNYAKEHLQRIIGKKSTAIETLLGFKTADEAIHRDNLVITALN